MSSRKPVIHGRDHLPGGADPIPVVAGAASYDPQTGEEHLYGDRTVLAGTSAFVALTYYAGDTLLNLATADKPTFVTSGVYAITAMIEVSGASATTTLSTMTLQIAQGGIAMPPSHGLGRAPGRYLQPPVGGGGDLFLEDTRVAKMVGGSPSNFFRVLFANDDAVDWNILCTVSVTRIIAI